MAKVDPQENAVLEEADVPAFIPFACHYNPHTILTKNGELLQTLKITGFTYESVNQKDNTKKTVRRALREAVAESIGSSDFALWIHTVRRRTDLRPGGKYRSGSFEESVNHSWDKHHDWQHKYVNELYVTIIHEGQNFRLHPRALLRSLSFGAERGWRELFLEDAYAKLETVTQKMLQRLQPFGVRRLSTVEYEGITYSEPLQFFGKIINLAEERQPMPIGDISQYLPNHTTSFGFNVFQVRGPTGTHFGSILSVKEYHEVNASVIDTFLQRDQEFIITETFDFINNDLVLKKYEHQAEILRISGDQELAKASGLTEIMESNKGRAVDFGEHQLTVTLLDDAVPALEKKVAEAFSIFGEMGVLLIREDVTMEECYWAQLPGNFEFLRRLSPINTARIGGFASLYNFPAGKRDNNHWGQAITVFHTKAGTPYFFNFHDKDNGHATIIGPYGSGKTVLLNFLTCEARKYGNRLFFFDQERASEIFLRAIGGTYKRVLKDPAATELRMNPLRLSDSKENRQFLKTWLHYLIMGKDGAVSAEDDKLAEQAVEYAFGLAEGERRLGPLITRFWPEGSSPTATALAAWIGNGPYAHIFDNTEDELSFDNPVHGFGLTEMVQENTPVVPIITYLLHRIRETLDGTPTMIVLDEAWSLIDRPAFAPFITNWLDDLRSKNTMVILATAHVEDAQKSNITREIADKIATQIFLPNAKATNAYTHVFGLTRPEFSMLKQMKCDKREFLLKHAGEAVVARLNLNHARDIVAVLSGKPENITLLDTLRQEYGDAPEHWLPPFKEQAK